MLDFILSLIDLYIRLIAMIAPGALFTAVMSFAALFSYKATHDNALTREIDTCLFAIRYGMTPDEARELSARFPNVY